MGGEGQGRVRAGVVAVWRKGGKWGVGLWLHPKGLRKVLGDARSGSSGSSVLLPG